jgi:hypothetical protein
VVYTLSNLEKWIREELTVDVESELSKYKEKMKAFVRLTPSGEVMLTQSNLTAKQKILLYLIGKVYSNIAKFSREASASNKELGEVLGLPEGTIKTSLFALRNEGLLIPQETGVHQIKIERIGTAFSNYFGESEK